MRLAEIQAQTPALRTLQQALARDRIAQSYLFVGPAGVGKESSAVALSAARNCPEGGCGACNTCRRIENGQHPDVRVFRPRDEGNRNLQVETVREEILPFTKFAPFEARTAFLIFPDADLSFPLQHAEAANAILKTLEEPRTNVVFVLLSSRPERLLATIRSRCQQVRFGPLPSDVLAAILTRHGIEPAVQASAIALAGGRADRALDMAREARSELMFEWATRLDRATQQGGVAERLELAEELARHEDRDVILETLCLYYRDVAVAGLGDGARLGFADRGDRIQARAAELSPGSAADRVLRIEQLSEALTRNANPQLALDALLLSLHR